MLERIQTTSESDLQSQNYLNALQDKNLYPLDNRHLHSQILTPHVWNLILSISPKDMAFVSQCGIDTIHPSMLHVVLGQAGNIGHGTLANKAQQAFAQAYPTEEELGILLSGTAEIQVLLGEKTGQIKINIARESSGAQGAIKQTLKRLGIDSYLPEATFLESIFLFPIHLAYPDVTAKVRYR